MPSRFDTFNSERGRGGILPPAYEPSNSLDGPFATVVPVPVAFNPFSSEAPYPVAEVSQVIIDNRAVGVVTADGRLHWLEIGRDEARWAQEPAVMASTCGWESIVVDDGDYVYAHAFRDDLRDVIKEMTSPSGGGEGSDGSDDDGIEGGAEADPSQDPVKPVTLSNTTDWAAILFSDGRLVVAGLKDHALRTATGFDTDQMVFAGVRRVWSGVGHTCYLADDGRLHAFGRAYDGQLGTGGPIRSTPSAVPFFSPPVAADEGGKQAAAAAADDRTPRIIACDDSSTIVVTGNGVYAVGLGQSSVLGEYADYTALPRVSGQVWTRIAARVAIWCVALWGGGGGRGVANVSPPEPKAGIH